MENLQIERRTVKDTDIFIGSKIIKEILPRVRTVFEEGALFVIYEEEQKDVAEALMQELKRGGYRVFASEIKADDCSGENVDIETIPEYVRFVSASVKQRRHALRRGFATLKISIGRCLCARPRATR